MSVNASDNDINPNKAGLSEGSFFWGLGEGGRGVVKLTALVSLLQGNVKKSIKSMKNDKNS